MIAYHHNHIWGDLSAPACRPIARIRTGVLRPCLGRHWARELIDAGASIYIAHGDPSLHGVEVYNGKLILHGLGNYISESVGRQYRTARSPT